MNDESGEQSGNGKPGFRARPEGIGKRLKVILVIGGIVGLTAVASRYVVRPEFPLGGWRVGPVPKPGLRSSRPATGAERPSPQEAGAKDERPANRTEQAQGQLSIRMPGNVTVDACTVLLSRAGRVTILTSGTPVDLEAGEYEITTAAIRVTDADGTLWGYSLTPDEQAPRSGPPTNTVVVEPSRATVVGLFADCQMTIDLHPRRAKPGETVQVDMKPVTAHGMRIVDCRWGEWGYMAQGDLVVLRPDGTVLSRQKQRFG